MRIVLLIAVLCWVVAPSIGELKHERSLGLRTYCAQTADAEVPIASTPIKVLLDSTEELLRKHMYDAALSAASKASDSAQKAKDLVGEAMAGIQEAQALEGLLRTDEAINAWAKVAVLWSQVPDGCGQIEALSNLALLQVNTKPAEAKARLTRAVAIAISETRRPTQAARELLRAARQAYSKGRPDLALILANAALPLLTSRTPSSIDVASCLNTLGDMADDDAHYQAAQDDYTKAISIEVHLRETAESVKSFNGLGYVAEDREDYSLAQDNYKHALQVAERIAPNSGSVAIAELNLGNVARKQQRWDEARSQYEAAIKILNSIQAKSLGIAACENNEGLIDMALGDLERARQEFEAARAIRQDIEPDSPEVAESLNNLALIDMDDGDLKTAEDLFRKAIAIEEPIDPGSPSIASYLNNLANIAFDRGDLRTADRDYQRALAIDEKVNPVSGFVAMDLASLGHVNLEEAKSSGTGNNLPELKNARTYLDQGFKILAGNPNLQLYKPEFLSYAGQLDLVDDKPQEALKEFHEAETIQRRVAPGSEELADYLGNEGDAELALKQGAVAETAYSEARRLMAKLPNSINTARLLSHIAFLRLNEGRGHEAVQLYVQALEIVDKQRTMIKGPDRRALLAQANNEIVEGLIGAYLADQGRTVDAFNAAERLRGLSLSESLFENKHIDFSKELSPDLLARQSQIANNRSIAVTKRQCLDPVGNREEYDVIDSRLEELDFQERQLDEDIRRSSPRYANLTYPAPFDVPATQKILDAGTLLMEYAVGAQFCYLFTVTRSSIHCYKLQLGASELRAWVGEMFRGVSQETAPWNPRISALLYDKLMRPATVEIEAAKRLLICPEKSLWKLPFCALIDNDSVAKPHFLVESKPIHTVVSMNVYAEILGDRNRDYSSERSFVAFGNPAYRTGRSSSKSTITLSKLGVPRAVSNTHGFAGAKPIQGPVSRISLGGQSFRTVAITGFQVRAIATLFGKKGAVFNGIDATRSKVLAEAPSAQIVHFACHAWLNDGRDPFSSYLALTPEQPSEQAGILAAYDVIQNLKLNANLVTLAACQTGAGQVSDTEGVIGLARAFLYAGAQSVLTTLWEVDANSSSHLMSGTDPNNPSKPSSKTDVAGSFYGALLAGQSKDEALRTAQVAMIHGKWMEYRDPRHWAAFSLQGDWK